MGQCFFFPWHPKCPWHKNSWFLSRALLIFHGQIFENFHGLDQNFHGQFFRNFHGQVGNFTGISKNSCHGHFNVCHGHFCALISIFLIYSSHNKGDIWSLTCRELTIFSKKSAYRAYQVKLRPPPSPWLRVVLEIFRNGVLNYFSPLKRRRRRIFLNLFFNWILKRFFDTNSTIKIRPGSPTHPYLTDEEGNRG